MEGPSPRYRSSTSRSLDRKNSPTANPKRKFSSRNLGRPSQQQFEANGRSVSELDLDQSEKLNQNVELNAASQNHLNLLMQQMLEKSEIEKIEEWKLVIRSLLLKLVSKLCPNVRNGNLWL